MNALRPTWDETWMNMAIVISERSLCDRDRVGAVVVDKDNRIVDSGYNGPPRGMPRDDSRCTNWCPRAALPTWIGEAGIIPMLDPAYDDCHSLHAEANALMFSDRRLREGGTIYVSSGVCGGCAKLIANSGLRRLVCDTSHEAPHRSSSEWFAWLRLCNIEVMEMRHE
jgi:dCMP deaminase